MNILAHHCLLVILIASLLEIVEIGDAYKAIRPYKYYQRRPLRRPRWYAGHKSSKFYHSKRIPPGDHYSGRPSYYRYGPGATRDDSDDRVESNPYTIVIQLPKAEKKYEHNYMKRKRKYGSISMPTYNSEDYIDDEDDFESRTVNVNNKKVQIKMSKGESPKLHIQISRSDSDKSIRIMDISNTSALPEMYNENSRMHQPTIQNWTSARFKNNFQNQYQPF